MHPAVAAYEAAYEGPEHAIDDEVARAFAADGALVSPWLERPVVGHAAIAQHVRTTRERLAGTTNRHTSVVERVGDVLRWTWAFEADGQTVASGMDVVVLSEDDRICLLTVFDGATPPGV